MLLLLAASVETAPAVEVPAEVRVVAAVVGAVIVACLVSYAEYKLTNVH